MDYRGDKIEVVIDWVEFEIQLGDRSNFWTVQDYLREALQLPEGSKPGVDALDATETGSASAFRFRVQDPRCMNTVVNQRPNLSSCQRRIVSSLSGGFD